MPEDGKIVPPFTKVTQGPTKTYMSFLDRLRESIQSSGVPEAARDSVLMSLAVQNANSALKRILMALPGTASIEDMVEVCENVGTLAENAVLMAEAFAVAVKLLVKQGWGDKGPHCIKCGKRGHVKAQCRASKTEKVTFSGACNRQKTVHRALECRPNFKKDGTHWETGRRAQGAPVRGPIQGATEGCLDRLCAATSGSAGADVCTAREVALLDSQAQCVPTNAKGPLGKGLSALLLG